MLYQIAGQVHGDPGRRGTPLAGARASAPYSPAERAALAAAARAQPTAARRAAAQLIIVFGTGAGLRQCELAALGGGDVTQAAGPAVVRVAGGGAGLRGSNADLGALARILRTQHATTPGQTSHNGSQP